MRKLTLRATVFLLALWGLSGPLGAQAIKVDTTKSDNNVTDGFCSLREALQAALDKNKVDTCTGPDWTQIEFNVAGTITIATPAIPFPLSSNLTLTGPVTISGGGISQIFVAGASIQLTLKKLTLIEAKMSGSGGALVTSSGGNVTIDDCKFEGNSANLGGAISNGGSILTITNSSFKKNEATTQGGAISTGGVVTIENTTFEDNTANGGGAINCTDGSLTITKATFTGNTALGAAVAGSFTDGGGAIKSGCTITTKTGTKFIGNKAEGPFGGGALLLTSAPIGSAIEDTTIESNKANGGGGMLCSFGSVAIRRSIFTANVASGKEMDMKFTRGGGAVMSSCVTTIEHGLFIANAALGRVGGGAVFFTSSASGSTVVQSVFQLNSAWLELVTEEKGGGGGIHTAANIEIHRSSFDMNSVHGDWGGAGILFNDSVSTVVNTSLLGNLSTLDGAIFYFEDPITGEISLGAPKESWVGGAIALTKNSTVQLIATSLARNLGRNELDLEFGSTSLAFLRTSLIDATSTEQTCGGETNNVVDADSHSQQAHQDMAAMTCTVIPQHSIGSLLKSDGDFGVVMPDGMSLKFRYTVPPAGSAAVNGGDPTTCKDPPVSGIDLLGKPRPLGSCSVGAVQVGSGG